jgi:hypothetical protein
LLLGAKLRKGLCVVSSGYDTRSLRLATDQKNGETPGNQLIAAAAVLLSRDSVTQNWRNQMKEFFFYRHFDVQKPK